ncbi:hypothetical protein QFZ65_002903 [Arthrobacter sp. B3I9]|uniref:hypothetical protein n=1 Tax=Arthrobacter sp. B3I9 TaxID=3042270 RepID=UPI00278E14B3|nr:hypothetical protein [Arthrobacter sp. B3I9]MDQ0850965.1 hypothetical protein [Arthrobacter sp. B3I9]
MRSQAGAVLTSLLACVLTAGCGFFPGSRTETCVDWIRFETPQELFDDAALVVVGTPKGRDGKTSIYGYSSQVHLVEVETVVKGQPGPGLLRVVSTPETCTGGVSYPRGDPLDGEQRMLIYASRQQDGWFTLTPAQGAVPFERGAALPFRAS